MTREEERAVRERDFQKIAELIAQDKDKKLTRREIARLVGRSERWVSDAIHSHPEWNYPDKRRSRVCTEENAERMRDIVGKHPDWSMERIGVEMGLSLCSVQNLRKTYHVEYKTKGVGCPLARRKRKREEPAPPPALSISETVKLANLLNMSYGELVIKMQTGEVNLP